MSFCQLRLATERPKFVLKNGSSKRGTCESAIHHQLDRVDVRRIVGREEEHGFGNFFRLAHTACGTAEEKNFANLAESSAEAEARGPRFQMGLQTGAIRVCGQYAAGAEVQEEEPTGRGCVFRLCVYPCGSYRAHATNLLANVSMWSRRPSART